MYLAVCADKVYFYLVSLSLSFCRRPYDNYFGGVTAISSEQFEQINGFSNIFWGWGSEDDDFLERYYKYDHLLYRIGNFPDHKE